MIQAFFMRTLVFDDFCFGNIGIPGDIGTIGKVRRKFEGAAFLYPPTRPEKQGKGVREGVPLSGTSMYGESAQASLFAAFVR